MIFDDFKIEGENVVLTISKSKIERMRDHYWSISKENRGDEFRSSFYLGKADVYIDILKCFYCDLDNDEYDYGHNVKHYSDD